MRRLLPLLVSLLVPATGHAAEAGQQLRAFLAETRTLEARFVQERLGEQGAAPERASGQLRLVRPGRFRWDYETPYEQLILADGERLWIYDPDLAQATVRPQAEALGNSPARLLSGGLDLDAHFAIIETGATGDEVAWVEVRPLGGEEEFSRMRFGFVDGRLASMVMNDNLGFETIIKFSNLEVNTDIDSNVFVFQPPPGVDVLGQ